MAGFRFGWKKCMELGSERSGLGNAGEKWHDDGAVDG